MKKHIFALNRENIQRIMKSVENTFSNCYVGDLSCMIDESDVLGSTPDDKKTVILNDGASFTPNRLMRYLCENPEKTETIAHVITMSKFNKFIKKSELMSQIVADSTFSIVWNYIGKDITDTIDATPDIKVIYMPKLMIPLDVASIYVNDPKETYFNLILMVVPDSHKEKFDEKRAYAVDLLQKISTVAIYKKCRDIIFNTSSITKNRSMIDDILSNMVKNTMVVKHIDSVGKVQEDPIQIHSIYELIEIGRF